MPVITTSSGFLFLSAITPIFAAAAAVASPGQIEAWTGFGAAVAMFLSVALVWIRSQKTHKIRKENILFTGLSAVAVGWILPEPLTWAAVRMGWLSVETVEAFPVKLWALMGLACGLSGTTLVLIYIYWSQSRLPRLIMKEDAGVMAGVEFPDGDEKPAVKQIQAAGDPGTTTK